MELLLLLLATTMLYSSAYLHSNYFYRMKSYSSKNLLKSSDNDESLTNSNVVTVTETKTRAEYALLFDCDGVIVETEVRTVFLITFIDNNKYLLSL